MSSPILIDATAFTEARSLVQGSLALNALDERVWSHELLVNADNVVNYRIQGGIDQWQRPFLDIDIDGQLDLCCQRCLQAVAYSLQESAHVVLFADETQLDNAMTADESVEGVLFAPEMDLAVLLEDQILMAIPFAPRHEQCENPTLTHINQDKTHPFAQLAGLKNGH